MYQTTLCMADLISLMYNSLLYWNILIVTVVTVVVVIWNHLFCIPNHRWGCMGNLNNFYSTATDLANVKKGRRRYQVIRKDRSQSISSILELLNGRQLRQSNIAQKSGFYQYARHWSVPQHNERTKLQQRGYIIWHYNIGWLSCYH